MSVQSYTSDSMTDESCIGFCSGYGLNYAGTEYSGECCTSEIPLPQALLANAYNANQDCANQLLSTINPLADCNMGCSGNSSEACGGPNRLSVFWNGISPSTGPVANPGVVPYSYVGCYK